MSPRLRVGNFFMTDQSKQTLRRAMLNRRAQLPQDVQISSGNDAALRMQDLPENNNPQHIGIYWAFRGEMPTEPLYHHWNREGAHLYLPRLDSSEQQLEFVEIKSMDQLMQSSLGFFQPDSNLAAVPVNLLELVVVPGVAFDIHGNRLGWGKGFYDKLLKNYSGKVIGLAYDFQIFEQIPHGPHDQPVHGIVSELRAIHCPRKNDEDKA